MALLFVVAGFARPWAARAWDVFTPEYGSLASLMAAGGMNGNDGVTVGLVGGMRLRMAPNQEASWFTSVELEAAYLQARSPSDALHRGIALAPRLVVGGEIAERAFFDHAAVYVFAAWLTSLATTFERGMRLGLGLRFPIGFASGGCPAPVNTLELLYDQYEWPTGVTRTWMLRFGLGF